MNQVLNHARHGKQTRVIEVEVIETCAMPFNY